MASHPYVNAGPGPSSYYQHSPPPHHVYGSHSPGPRPNYQPYPYPGPPLPPPHMNQHHQPPRYHALPSRGNPRGGGNAGAPYGSRGSHHYQNYHPPPPQQQPSYPHPSHAGPPLAMHPPPPQHHMPYSPPSAKYNQPYSPTYHYPSPTAPVFTPSWQTQPISPLPKQLSMPTPQNLLQPFYEPPTQPQEAPQTPLIPVPIAESPEPPAAVEEPLEEKVETPAPSTPAPSSPVTPASPAPVDSEVIPQSSSYSQMGSITTPIPMPSSPKSTTESSHSLKIPAQRVAHWAIWSRRPQDPSHAPSIIISPRARPPLDVVQQALDLKTPPPTPPPSSPAASLKILPPVADEEQDTSTPSSTIPLADEQIVWSSQTNSTVPSPPATETTDTPAIPGSPASSNTSLSVAGTPIKGVGETSPAPLDQVEPIVMAAPISAIEEVEPVAPTVIETQPPVPAASIPIPTQVPVAAPPAPKKLWAALLRPAASDTPTRNALPTSSVVGFSIPASAMSGSSSTPNPVSPSKKTELITLLSSGPTAVTPSFSYAAAGSAKTAAAALSRIRPRGLINNGNMCFANSVLQVLVYCPPFHRLFGELGRLLGARPAPTVNGANHVKDGPDGATPLIDATIEFLREFVEDKKAKAKEREKERVVIGSNGRASVSGSRGKGKEREIVLEKDERDDWDGESFLPSYVYDAMKAKKRFDTMRGGHQEDAEEFFGFYLDALEEELLSILHSVNPPRQNKAAAAPAPVEEKEESAPPEDNGWLEVGRRNRTVVTRTIRATESPITHIFGGKFRSTLRAPGQKDSVIVEDWRSLRLDIQREQIHTIQDALSSISHPQPVQVTQAARPGITIEAQQQVLIEALPPILVLHIKRFCYDTAVGGVVKVGKQVRFGPELEIGSDIMVSAAKKAQPARYKLFGALYHHGLSALGGHYTLDVLHPNRYPSANPTAKPREGWVRIDDELVSDVRPEDVFGASERDDGRCAYLLFYRRI